ncbi:MAG TPA: hypothetical protein VGU01_08960 [Sphingomicrobium sp.]|nr:hypothetical protein [Sphingomicrobium sp.]
MKSLTLCLIVLVSACHDHQPRAPSAAQSQQLNEAEDMLNNMSANEEGPADRSTGPSKGSN